MKPFPTLRVALLRAPDDDASFSPNYQRELKQFYNLVRADRTRMSAVAFTIVGVTGESGFTGEFAVPLAQDVGPALGRAAFAWMQEQKGTTGRSARLSIGELDFDVRSFDEFDSLIAKVRAINLSQSRER